MIVSYSRSSFKYLSKLEKKVQLKLVRAIDRLPDLGDIKKMRGQTIESVFRLRIGKYRVVFQRKEGSIRILAIDTRGDIYKQLP